MLNHYIRSYVEDLKATLDEFDRGALARAVDPGTRGARAGPPDLHHRQRRQRRRRLAHGHGSRQGHDRLVAARFPSFPRHQPHRQHRAHHGARQRHRLRVHLPRAVEDAAQPGRSRVLHLRLGQFAEPALGARLREGARGGHRRAARFWRRQGAHARRRPHRRLVTQLRHRRRLPRFAPAHPHPVPSEGARRSGQAGGVSRSGRRHQRVTRPPRRTSRAGRISASRPASSTRCGSLWALAARWS